MKYKFTYLLPLIALFAAACSNKTAPVPIPSGTFSGVFTRLHVHAGVTDTVRANITLTMQLATGYAVTGDTTTVHAGSHGSYVINPNNILQFTDNTLPPVVITVPVKVHLAGTYQYEYDGTNFAIFNIQDTVAFEYALKKIAN